MNTTKFLILFIAVAMLAGCSGIKVTADFEKDTDFSKYKTYSFLGWQDNSDQIMNDFDKKRVHDAFKTEFEKRNLTLQQDGADMAVSLYIVVSQEKSVTAYTDYYGGYGGRYRGYRYGWGAGYSTTQYRENDYLKGTLVMDVFDEKSGEMIWQGIAVSTIEEDPAKREKSIPKKVGALMNKFPIKQDR